MTEEPYRSVRRVFWVMDNGSAHRGAKGDARLQAHWLTLQDSEMGYLSGSANLMSAQAPTPRSSHSISRASPTLR